MNPSKEQADAMKAIGFSAYDAQGKMKPLSQIIGELGTKTKGLTNEQRDNAIATIMGTNSLSGMQVLLKDGRGNLDTLTASLKKSGGMGAAKSMANTMQGNTKGAIEQMKGSLETAAITVQEKLAPSITRAANAVQELANKFAQLSPAQQDMIIKGAAIVAIVGPIVLLMGKMISGVGAIAGAISTLTGAIAVVATGAEAATPAVAGLASAIKFMTGPIGLTILAITAVVTAFLLLWNKCEGFRNFWIGLWNGIKTAAQAVGAWFSGPFIQFFQSAGNGIKSFFTGIPAFFHWHLEQYSSRDNDGLECNKQRCNGNSNPICRRNSGTV
jgi:phage-related minor tail protein